MPTTWNSNHVIPQLDHIGAVLYLAHSTHLDRVICDSGKRMATDCGSEFPWLIAEMATQPGTARNVKIAAFFVLLNVDIALKQAATSMCPHKAGVFFQALHSSVVPGWLSDERIGIASFVDALKDCYRNS